MITTKLTLAMCQTGLFFRLMVFLTLKTETTKLLLFGKI
nr:MAG TPA: hypothetical protein [Caudoviricetes sp.]